jgi:hypothetical protein
MSRRVTIVLKAYGLKGHNYLFTLPHWYDQPIRKELDYLSLSFTNISTQ